MLSTRSILLANVGLSIWLAAEQQASAQVVLAQSGMAKTAVGWALVVVALFFALLFIGLPSWRKLPEGDAKPTQQQRR